MAIDYNARSSGLALLWLENVNFELISFFESIIHGRIHGSPGRLFIGVYGCLKMEKRVEFWSLLKYLRPDGDIPWLLIGDSMRSYLIKRSGS